MILDVMRRQKRLFAWVLLPLLVVGLVGYLIPGVGVEWGQEIGVPFVARVGSAEISPVGTQGRSVPVPARQPRAL